jgi:malonate-semialdehyde dehydrogenase (acetylating)/methylmalonate-semialdehyde dehydrogenase
VFRGYEVVEHC